MDIIPQSCLREWPEFPVAVHYVGDPFNRTSMELKHDRVLLLSVNQDPFNRTSMELKPTRHTQGLTMFIGLLIETSMELKRGTYYTRRDCPSRTF